LRCDFRADSVHRFAGWASGAVGAWAARELAVADVFGLLERFKEYPWLHVIDLDAAMRKGENNKLVEELCRARED